MKKFILSIISVLMLITSVPVYAEDTTTQETQEETHLEHEHAHDSHSNAHDIEQHNELSEDEGEIIVELDNNNLQLQSPQLFCNKEEHTHSSDCFSHYKVLICENSEEEHVHMDECFQNYSFLVCNREEHVHTENCYDENYQEPEIIKEEPSELETLLNKAINNEEGYYLSCNKIEHKHTPECFQEIIALICQREESFEEENYHQHSEDCYDTYYVITCNNEEHTHDFECIEQESQEFGEYIDEIPDDIPADAEIPEDAPLVQMLRSPLRGSNDRQIYVRSLFVQVFKGGSWQDDKYVKTVPNSATGQRFAFRINFALSGVGEIDPYDVENPQEGVKIVVPKQILRNRLGELADSYEMSIPHISEIYDEDLDPEIYYCYYEEDDNIVIVNFRERPAGDNGYIEMAFSTTQTTFNYEDMCKSDDFFATIYATNNGESVEEESNHIPVYLNTTARITSTYKQYPTKYDTWQSSWGTAPADANDYFYFVWQVRSNINKDASQPYNLTFADTTTSSYGASEFVAYKFRGQSEWTTNNTVTNQTITGDRYDSVLTKHLKSDFDPLDYWTVKNRIEVELTPADGLDPKSNVNSTNEYKYQYHVPVWHYPTGHFQAYKYADGSYRSGVGYNVLNLRRGRFSRYDLQDWKSSELDIYDTFDWGVIMEGYPYPWTIDASADRQDVNSYGVTPVTFEVSDNTLFLGQKNDRQLTWEDYEIDTLNYSWAKTKDAVMSWKVSSNGDTSPSYSTKAPVFEKDTDIIYFYAELKNSGDFVLCATHDLRDDSVWFDPNYVASIAPSSGSQQIVFVDNITGYKVKFDSSYYYTNIELCLNAHLKHSNYIDNYCSDKFSIMWGNTANAKYFDNRGETPKNVFSGDRTDWNYASETIIERHSNINKRTTSATNITKKRLYEIGWKVDMRETIKINEDPVEYVEQDSGIFYDLLPAGSTFNPASISVKAGSTYLRENEYRITQIPNYRDTGRILLTVEILTETPSTYEMYYTTIHPWDSIKDFGEYVYNPVAYETGNPQIYNGRKNDGGSLGETMANLGANGNTEPKFLYSSSTHNILALTSAISGLTKKVKNDSDKNYTYDTTTKNNGAYSYRLRYQTTFGNTAKNLIFFDSLENYVVDSNASDWYGTIESFDIAQLRAKGIEPVIYLSEVTNFDLEQYNVYTDFSDVFLNGGDWVRIEDFGDLSRAKAFAIDCRKKTDGSEFVLGESESIQAVVYMRAPAGADDINSTGTDYPETYNNIYIRNTVTGIDGDPQDFYIHQDYTTVRFVVKNDISLEKVSSEDSERKLKDIKFRLTGTSDYGTEIDEIKTTDKFGKITFEEIEKGRYILQEYETTKDWLLDTTEHIVVIDSEGKVFVDEQEITNSYIQLENDPRIYADVPLQKRREGDSTDDIELKQLLASAEVDSEVEYNGKTYKILEKTTSKARVKEIPQGEAYAVYDSSDETVTFFRDTPGKYRHKQTEGTKTYYTGIETTNYTGLNNPPWFSYDAFRTIILEDVISPISTCYWFARSLEIVGLDKLDTSKVTNMSYMFDNSKATSLDLSNFDTSKVTEMTEMFSESRATSLDLSSFDTSKVTNMYSMFSFSMATSLDLSSFNTSSVTNMGEMFYESQATSLDLSSFDTSEVTYMSSMFASSQATSLDLSSFDTSKVTDMEYMFAYSSSLSSIYVSSLWNVNNIISSYGMFYNCANLPNFNSSYVDETRANYNEGGYLTYKAYIPPTSTQPTQPVKGYWISTEIKPQTPIANTTFKLSGTSDYGNEIIQILTTNTAGKLVFEEIEQGTYELVEVSPNEDFILNETKWIVTIGEDRSVSITSKEEDRDRLYEIGEDENTTFKTIYNEPRYWGFTLRKIDKENTSIWLEGATFALKGISDLGTNYDLEVNSDANGRVVFDRIEKGTYLLKETVAPANVNENGQIGGNRNYIADSKQYIVEIDCFGNVKIDGLKQNEYDDFEVKNDRALDGKITIIKKWEDNKDPDGRPTPVVHLSTGEPEGLAKVILTFDANGGYFENNNSSINRVIYKGTYSNGVFEGEIVEGSIQEPTREGCSFEGWYEDENFTVAWDGNLGFEDNKQLYAKWKFFNSKLAVKIYGIGDDIDINDNITGLTVGSTIGINYTESYSSHQPTGETLNNNPHRCFHDDSWEEVVYWNNIDPYVYEQCVNSCTHSLNLNISDEFLNNNYTYQPLESGDGVGALFYEFKPEVLDIGESWTSSTLRSFLNNEYYGFITFLPSIISDSLADRRSFYRDPTYSLPYEFFYDKIFIFSTAELTYDSTASFRALSHSDGISSAQAELHFDGRYYGNSLSGGSSKYYAYFGVNSDNQISQSPEYLIVRKNKRDTYQYINEYGQSYSYSNPSNISSAFAPVFSLKSDFFKTNQKRGLMRTSWSPLGTNGNVQYYKDTNLISFLRPIDPSLPAVIGEGASLSNSISVVFLTDDEYIAPINSSSLFSNVGRGSYLDLSYDFDGNSPTFYNGATLDLSQLNTQSTTNMEKMFYNSSFKELILGENFITSSVTNTRNMFNGNWRLEKIFVYDDFDISNITLDYNMFYNSSKLPNISSPYDKTRANYSKGGFFTHISELNNTSFNQDTSKYLISNIPQQSSLLEKLGIYTKVYAEDGDIDSGVYDNVDWRITAEGELIIGKEGEVQEFTYRDTRSYDDYPWYSKKDNINSVRFAGTVKGNGSMAYMFTESEATSIDLSNFDTSNVTNMAVMFTYSKAASIDLSSFDTSKVTKMGSMFAYSQATSINLGSFDTSNVTDMNSMFSNSKVTTLDLGSFDTSNVTDMSFMFTSSQVTSIDLSNFNTSNVTNMQNMFAFSKATSIIFPENFGSASTNMYAMFSHSQATSLDLSNFNTSKVTSMQSMFDGSQVISLDLSSFNTSNVTRMQSMFRESKATSLNLSSFDTSNVTDMTWMFRESQATFIDLSSFNMSKVTKYSDVFKESRVVTIVFSDDIIALTDGSFNSLPGKWIKIKDKFGNKLYDQTAYTSRQVCNLTRYTTPTLSGTWMNKSVLDPTSNPDGTYTWTTVDLLWTDNGDGTWTYTFDVFDDNLTYYFWEEDLEGYESDIEWIPGYKVLDGSKEKIGYITNRSTEFGSLKIEKEVEWYESPRENLYFDFNIQLEGSGIEGRQVFSDVIFNDGYARVKLKDGESVVIQGLPAGITYSVKEIERSDFTIQKTGDSGTIESQVVKEAKFINSEVPYETLASSTQVTLRKQIVGIENQENYTFYVEFTNLAKDTTYYVSNGDSFTSDANGYAFYEASISSGTEITFDEIPYEATYQVTETAGDYISSFEILEHLSVSQGSNSNSQVNKQLSTAKETINIGDSPIVVFTNTFETKQNLKIKKEVVGTQEDKSAEYEFTIELEDLVPGKTIESDAGRFVADEDGYSIKTIILKDGEEFNIYELPLGSSYKVIESANNCYASYEISDANNSNSIQKQFDINGEVNKSLSTDYEIVDMGEDVTVKFVNYSQVTLKLIKKVDGNMGDKSAKFNFDIELNIPEIFEGKIEDLQIIESKDLSHDEFVEYKIPYGTEYSISEDDYSSQGYKTYVNNGLMQSRELSDEIKNNTEVTFRNVNGVVIPTGIKIFTAIPLVSLIALGIFLTRKKKERD